MQIRPAIEDDLHALLEIHNYAVRSLDAIWTEHEDTDEERMAWFRARTEAGFPVLVATDDAGAVVGFGTFGTYRSKPGYRLTVEHSVYLLPEAQGRGIGRALMERLIEIARAQGRHVMMAVIDDRNGVSIRMHERLGFEVSGRLPQVGIKHGRWLGQMLMYLLLDERETPGDA